MCDRLASSGISEVEDIDAGGNEVVAKTVEVAVDGAAGADAVLDKIIDGVVGEGPQICCCSCERSERALLMETRSSTSAARSVGCPTMA